MSRPVERACCALALALTVAGVVVTLVTSYGFPRRPGSTVADVLAGAATSAGALMFVGLGTLIVRRTGGRQQAEPAGRGGHRGHVIGWLCVLTGGALIASSAGSGAGGLYQAGVAVPLGDWAAWLDDWVWALMLLGIWLILVLFPDGRATTRVSRVAVVVSLVVAGAVVLTFPFVPGMLVDLPGVANPMPPVPVLSALAGPVHDALVPAMVVTFLLAVACVVVRYRTSDHEVRAQIRWLGWSGLVVVLCLVVQNVTPSPWRDAAQVLSLVPLLPVAIAVAVLRYRLYDIDRLLSRTVSYALLTGLVVAVYVGVVALASVLVPEASGSLGVAVATLAAVSLVRPLRRRLQDVVDRRFDRARSDARRAVDDYADRLRTLDTFQETDLHDVLARTVAPTRAWLWQPPVGTR